MKMSFNTLKLFLIIALLCFSTREVEARDCQLKQFFSLKTRINEDGSILVPIQYDSLQFEALFDPLAIVDGTIKESIVKKLNIDTEFDGTDKYYFQGRTRLTRYANMENIRLGNNPAPKGKFYIVPDTEKYAVDANIGLNYFRGLDSEFDLKNNKINFFSSDHCPGKVVYWSNEWLEERFYSDQKYRYYIPVKLNGEKVNATLNFFHNYNKLIYTAAERNHDFNLKREDIGKFKHFETLEMAGIVLHDVDIMIEQGNISDPIELFLGTDFFKNVRVYFSYDEKKIYLTPAQ